MRHVEGPVEARVDQPGGEAGEHPQVSHPVAWHGSVQGDRRDHNAESNQRSRETMSSVVSATATPACRKASSLLFAVPRFPEMMAPACPIRLPSGAVRPEMKATVLRSEEHT